MKFASCLAALTTALIVSPLQAQAPDPPKETRVVLRISREFIHTLLGVRFQGDEPIDSSERGVVVAGNAHFLGKTDITLHKSETESDFDLLITGTIDTQINAAKRPVVVFAHGGAPFSVSRRIVFDGKKFTGQPICMTVANRFALDDITTARGRPLGPVARGLVTPIVRRGLADGDRQADNEIRAKVSTQVEELTNKLLDALNKVEPAIHHAKEVIHADLKAKDADLRILRAATSEHLLISIGHPDRVMAKLPALKQNEEAPVELWIHQSLFDENAHMRFLKDHWQDLKKLVHDQLIQRHRKLEKDLRVKLPDILKIEPPMRVKGTPGYVIRFAPKFRELPIFTIPQNG
ncbi:MAG: hypothetical protein HY289_06955 [Planctomycetes bacterium]|nr:hypothetical protein [Planctomycetota bacterium]